MTNNKVTAFSFAYSVKKTKNYVFIKANPKVNFFKKKTQVFPEIWKFTFRPSISKISKSFRHTNSYLIEAFAFAEKNLKKIKPSLLCTVHVIFVACL